MQYTTLLKNSVLKLIGLCCLISLLFASCEKKADPSIIKVSNAPISGSTAGTGSGTGVGTGTSSATGTITFAILGKTYTLSSGSGGFVNCATSPAIAGLPATTSLQGANADQSVTFSLYSNSTTAGTYPLSQFSITTPDGVLYTPTAKASVTYTSFTTKLMYLGVTKGTFEIPAEYGSLPDRNTTTITGSFDIK